MIQIYGSPRTSAGRCFWMLEELGLPYEVKTLNMSEKEHKSPDYLKLNPNGKVPVLIDDGFVIWESVAINQYLAEKYKPELLGQNPQERGLIQQWSVWAMVEFQPPLVDLIIQMMFVPEDKRDANVIARAKEKVPPTLKILDQALAGQDFVVGNRLTVADFNLASVVNIAQALRFELDTYPNVVRWFGRMKDRPSYKRLSDMRSH